MYRLLLAYDLHGSGLRLVETLQLSFSIFSFSFSLVDSGSVISMLQQYRLSSSRRSDPDPNLPTSPRWTIEVAIAAALALVFRLHPIVFSSFDLLVVYIGKQSNTVNVTSVAYFISMIASKAIMAKLSAMGEQKYLRIQSASLAMEATTEMLLSFSYFLINSLLLFRKQTIHNQIFKYVYKTVHMAQGDNIHCIQMIFEYDHQRRLLQLVLKQFLGGKLSLRNTECLDINYQSLEHQSPSYGTMSTTQQLTLPLCDRLIVDENSLFYSQQQRSELNTLQIHIA